MESNTAVDKVDTAKADEDLLLAPPRKLEPVAADTVRERVPIEPQRQQLIDSATDRMVNELLALNMESQDFKDRLDRLMNIGREEIAKTASALQGNILDENFVGQEKNPAYLALMEMRQLLDKLAPGESATLLQPHHALGFIPWGTKLQAYFRKFQSARTQIKVVMEAVYKARDATLKRIEVYDGEKASLWTDMVALAEKIRYAEAFNAKLKQRVDDVRLSDPRRARLIETEVMFYVGQNLEDMQVQQAINVNGYLSFDILRKSGRDLANGCSRVATNGMSALAVAQKVARGCGEDVQVMDLLVGLKGSIGRVIDETGDMLGNHVDRTIEFAATPLLGVEQIKTMFDKTFAALDKLDEYRLKAVATFAANNELIRSELERSQQHLDRVRSQEVAAALTA